MFRNKDRSFDLQITWIRLQITGIPVVFTSAKEGRGRMAVMRQVIETYEKWCLRLPTARLNRWLRKVVSNLICCFTQELAIPHLALKD